MKKGAIIISAISLVIIGIGIYFVFFFGMPVKTEKEAIAAANKALQSYMTDEQFEKTAIYKVSEANNYWIVYYKDTSYKTDHRRRLDGGGFRVEVKKSNGKATVYHNY